MKILLVEDKDNWRNLLVEILSDGGHQITPASNLDKGMESIEGEDFDLLLSDWNLQNGDTARDIVDAAISKSVPVIIQSTEEELMKELYGNKVEFVEKGKPDTLSRIEKSIEGHMGHPGLGVDRLI